jgi:hypothetical protein
MPVCLAEVTFYFPQHGIVPDHMLLDAGLDNADGLSHLVFWVSEMPVDNCTACVMVATSAFSPLSVPPATAVIITGIGCIPHINPFLGKLIGGLAMAYLRSFYLHPITGDMDCKSVIRLQVQQKHFSPEQSQSQEQVYGLILRTFFQGKGRTVRSLRSSIESPTRRNRGRRRRLDHAVRPFPSSSGPIATGLTTSPTVTRAWTPRPQQTMRSATFDLERSSILTRLTVMSEDSFYWLYNAPPPLRFRPLLRVLT